jgi:hypothetical protein
MASVRASSSEMRGSGRLSVYPFDTINPVPSIHLPDGSILDLRVGDALAPDVLRAFAVPATHVATKAPSIPEPDQGVKKKKD